MPIKLNQSPLTEYINALYGMIATTLGVPNSRKVTWAQLKRCAAHPTVAFGLNTIKRTVLSCAKQLECEDEDVAAFLRREYIDKHSRDVEAKLLRALEYGFTPLEIVYKPLDDGGHWGYREFRDPDPERVSWVADNNGDFKGFVQRSGGSDIFVPREYAIWYAHGMRHGNRYGEPLTLGIFQTWYKLELLELSCGRAFERFGAPFAKVFYPPDVGSEQLNYSKALEIAKTLCDNSSIALERSEGLGWDVEVSNPPAGDTAWGEILSYFNAQILRGLLIPEMLLTDSQTGSYSKAVVQSDIWTFGIDALADEICGVEVERCLKPLAKYNFDYDGEIKFSAEPIGDKKRQLLLDIVTSIIDNVAGGGEWERWCRSAIEDLTGRAFETTEVADD